MNGKIIVIIRNFIITWFLTFIYDAVVFCTGLGLAFLSNFVLERIFPNGYLTTAVLILPTAAMGVIDILLFKPLDKLYKDPVWVYILQSCNLHTLFVIAVFIVYGCSFSAIAFDVAGVGSLATSALFVPAIGGTVICFIWQTVRLTRLGYKKETKMKRILIGMSGGVDSSAAALLLKWQGYEVSGCTLKLTDNDMGAEDARAVCQKLGIPHAVLDLRQLFREKVMDKFAEGYISGKTPNPCLYCNRAVKFGEMLDRALEMGCDGIATGHYAQIRYDGTSGRYLLVRPADRKKDQTYVLYGMTQFQLAHTVFPLYELEKAEIRRLAEENGLVSADRPDSQDICFIPDGDYAKFIGMHTGRTFPRGNFVDASGNILGEHSGIIGYTIGQRKGLGAAFGKPMYVCGKNAADNTVTLGDEADLFRKELYLSEVNLISLDKLTKPMRVTAKTRYSAKDQAATVYPEKNGLVKILFDEAVRAPAAGQACVFYDGDIVVGGGIII